jgi:hypothetical protein
MKSKICIRGCDHGSCFILSARAKTHQASLAISFAFIVGNEPGRNYSDAQSLHEY